MAYIIARFYEGSGKIPAEAQALGRHHPENRYVPSGKPITGAYRINLARRVGVSAFSVIWFIWCIFSKLGSCRVNITGRGKWDARIVSG